MGSCRSQKQIHIFEFVFKIFPNHVSDFLGPRIISVIISSRENVSSKNNSPPHLFSESALTRFGINIKKILSVLTESISNSVKAREIRGNFRGHDDIIRGKCVLDR